MIKKIALVVFLLSLTLSTLAENKYIHHDLSVVVNPSKQQIHVTDAVTFPTGTVKNKIHFLLHGNLTVTAKDKDIKIVKEKGQLKSQFFGINTAKFEIKKKIPVNHYSLQFPGATGKPAQLRTVTLEYEGKIRHPIKKLGAEYARGFSETPGIICDKGVFLAGASFWVPWFNDQLVSFKLSVTLPEQWDSVSQGKRAIHEKKNSTQVTVWDSPEPMDEVYLVAANFKEYSLKVGKVNVLAYLRTDDEGLANKYLETTGQYLEMYEKLIGPYPYSKFALIENFWETGYGMPSFTLLGEKIIRFPFILHSSYPHELLHNYWGNSVFVDYDAGNWCEGLTVYQADHLIKQQRGQGADYRKTTLQGYTHYAAGKEEEFPLTKFKARYDALSSSIGYGKSMMVFHMLRKMVGDKLFNKAIQYFYKENKYKRATFDDIRKSFEEITGKDLKGFFHQWVTRTGVPEIRVTDASVSQKNGRYHLVFSLAQVQEGDPYSLRVPMAVYLEGEKEALVEIVETDKKNQSFTFIFDKRPLGLDADPQFDVFRKLHENEIPATMSNAFGAKAVLMLLPSNAPQELLTGYKSLADTWAKESAGKIEIKTDDAVSALPDDKAVWLLGRENRFNKIIKDGITPYNARFLEDSVTINKKNLPFAAHSIIAAVKNPNNPSLVVVLVSTDRAAALPGLGRKLPHYGKYSYLAFEGDEPDNMLKGQWPAVNSPMSVKLDRSVEEFKRKLPREEPLGRLAPLFSSKRMMEHISFLASDETEGRGLGTQGLEKAGQYIAEAFKKAGLKPGGDNGSYFQTWEAVTGKDKRKMTLRNVIGIIPGKDPAFKDQAVVLCAHYDHLGRGWPDVHKGDEGKIHYGADDNASGVSVMLELAHVLGTTLKPERSIEFIAFTGEENGLMGSAHYMEQSRNQSKKIMSAVNLDTVGRLTEGKKLMVIGGSSAREWRFIFMGIGYTVGIEAQLVTQDLDASDQVNFHKAGIPAIQLFSGPHTDYHRPTDTIDKIDAAGLVKVAAVAREAIVYLADRKEPLTVKISGNKAAKPAGPAASSEKGGRRVRTGIMPDFGFSGKGMKVGFVSPDSPAAQAGLQKGDIVVKVGSVPVATLKEYSEALKAYKPGDVVVLEYLRDGKTHSTSVTLTTR